MAKPGIKEKSWGEDLLVTKGDSGGVSIVWQLGTHPLASVLLGFNTSWTILIKFTKIPQTSVSSSTMGLIVFTSKVM